MLLYMVIRFMLREIFRTAAGFSAIIYYVWFEVYYSVIFLLSCKIVDSDWLRDI